MREPQGIAHLVLVCSIRFGVYVRVYDACTVVGASVCLIYGGHEQGMRINEVHEYQT